MPPEVKKERLHAVEELEQRDLRRPTTCATRAASEEVLVEGKRDGRWHGRTRSNKLVHFAGDTQIGELVTVHIDHAGAWSLSGTVASDALPLFI